jgi:hypothetical protein
MIPKSENRVSEKILRQQKIEQDGASKSDILL